MQGIYIRTSQARENMSKAHKGVKLTAAHRKSIIESHQMPGYKGRMHRIMKLKVRDGIVHPPGGWNAGMRFRGKRLAAIRAKWAEKYANGYINPSAGVLHSKARKSRNSKILKKLWCNEEYRNKMLMAHAGRIKGKGELHYNFQNWKSLEPYGEEFNNKKKEKIRRRDGCKCAECGDLQLKGKRRLSIHHIDYNKQNNKDSNLISLCHFCHIKTNYGRGEWIKYFKKLIAKKLVSTQ